MEWGTGSDGPSTPKGMGDSVGWGGRTPLYTRREPWRMFAVVGLVPGGAAAERRSEPGCSTGSGAAMLVSGSSHGERCDRNEAAIVDL